MDLSPRFWLNDNDEWVRHRYQTVIQALSPKQSYKKCQPDRKGDYLMSSTSRIATPSIATEDFSTWNIDPAHSTAEFKVRHMMISYVKGKFSGLSGVLKLDETDYAHSSIEASI